MGDQSTTHLSLKILKSSNGMILLYQIREISRTYTIKGGQPKLYLSQRSSKPRALIPLVRALSTPKQVYPLTRTRPCFSADNPPAWDRHRDKGILLLISDANPRGYFEVQGLRLNSWPKKLCNSFDSLSDRSHYPQYVLNLLETTSGSTSSSSLVQGRRCFFPGLAQAQPPSRSPNTKVALIPKVPICPYRTFLYSLYSVGEW